MRYAVAILISIVVLNSVFGGNYKNESIMKAPEWIENLFKVSCVCGDHKFYVQA